MKHKLLHYFILFLFSIIFKNTSGQILHYEDIAPDEVVAPTSFPTSTKNWNIDITGDSVTDFTFISSINWGERIAKLSSHNGCQFSVLGNYVDTLNINDPVSDTMEWVAGTRQFVYYFGNDPSGVWINVNNKFMAIRIPSEKGWKYGWFRLNIYDNVITVKDYAISDITGFEIYAGEALPPVARNVIITDVSNYKDGRDIKVTADTEINDYLVEEYRVICVKTDSAQSFTLNKALNLNPERYKSIIPTGNNIEITLDSVSVDSDGDAVQEFVSYNVFVLSATPNTPGSPDPCLSLPSNSLILKSYAVGVTDITVAKDYNHDMTFTLDVSFQTPEDEAGITEYRLYFVKNSDSNNFTIDTALNVSPDYYFQFIPNGQNHSISLLTSGIFDYKGNTIEISIYRVFVLSLADGIICNVHTMHNSGVFDLRLIAPAVGEILVCDNGNNSNAGDINIVFDSVNESKIYAYRIILVKEDEVPDFTLEKANALEQGNWFDIFPSNININVSLSPEINDSQGDMIYEDAAYRAFVLTLADTINTNSNSLSNPSNIISISNPDHFRAGQKAGIGVIYTDIEPDVELFPIKETLTYYIDINDDGIDDYFIRATHNSSPSFTEVQTWCVPLNGNEVNTTAPESNALDVLDSAYMISRHLQWNSSEAAFFYAFESIVPGSSYSWGLWHGIGFKYLGLRMFNESDTIYGWLNLKIYGGSVVIQEFASRLENPNSFDEIIYGLSVYPNPATGTIFIFLPNGFSGVGYYNLIAINGKTGISGDFSGSAGNRLTLDISTLKSGIYILIVKTGNTVFNQRVIIQ